MLVSYLNTTDPNAAIKRIVASVSHALYNGNLRADCTSDGKMTRNGGQTRFVLRVKCSDGPGARRSPSGRRIPAATWEAHKVVMQQIFAEYPKCRIKSALATYHGREAFERLHEATYNHEVRAAGYTRAFGAL